MPKGNPDPIRTPGFLAQQQPKYGDQALGKTRGTRYPLRVDAALELMDSEKRQNYIRQAVEEKMIADELLPRNPEP